MKCSNCGEEGAPEVPALVIVGAIGWMPAKEVLESSGVDPDEGSYSFCSEYCYRTWLAANPTKGLSF